MQEEKGTAEEEMVGWHHRHNGHEFEKTLGVSDGQGSPAYCIKKSKIKFIDTVYRLVVARGES